LGAFLAQSAKNRAFRFNLLAVPKGFSLQSLARPRGFQDIEQALKKNWLYRCEMMLCAGIKQHAVLLDAQSVQNADTAEEKGMTRAKKCQESNAISLWTRWVCLTRRELPPQTLLAGRGRQG
jgi:hypothetical protein